jgi:hypothetical protein
MLGGVSSQPGIRGPPSFVDASIGCFEGVLVDVNSTLSVRVARLLPCGWLHPSDLVRQRTGEDESWIWSEETS